MTTTTLVPGCYIDGHRGHYAVPAVVAFAQAHGFELDPFAAYTLDRYDADSFSADYPHEAVHELSEEAIAFLNEHAAPEGYTWAWNDGDFGLYADDADESIGTLGRWSDDA